MNERVDIIIPTCNPWGDVAKQAGEAIATAGIRPNLIATCQEGSAAQNRNRGLEQARSPIRIMVDDDIARFSMDWAGRLVDVLETRPECEMVSAFLVNPDDTPAVMMGYTRPRGGGIHEADGPHLISACCAIRNNVLRFDEGYIGSGWEETDYCMQLRRMAPACTLLIDEDVRVVHLNEQKNQAEHFEQNKKLYVSKWGEPR